MKVAITGASGFLGWHLRCALRADGRHDVVPLDRSVLSDGHALARALSDCDAVVHLAGVNRGTDAEVSEGNTGLGVRLVEAMRGSRVRSLIYGNSIQSGSPSPFGRSKEAASAALARYAEGAGIVYTDVRLPNLFGEGGRPFYNSVIATFCHQLTSGQRPTVLEDRELPLLHAQDAADELIRHLSASESSVQRPGGRLTPVSEALAMLEGMSGYPVSGDLPELPDTFHTAMFTTFLSFCFPRSFPIARAVHRDARGSLFEVVRARSTDSASFVSTTVPGAVRGQHFHRRKVERFLVVDGEAEIRLRRVGTHEEVAFHVSGAVPQAVDMPTLWAHSLKNTGTTPLTTVFWTNELLDPGNPDTYPYDVYAPEPSR